MIPAVFVFLGVPVLLFVLLGKKTKYNSVFLFLFLLTLCVSLLSFLFIIISKYFVAETYGDFENSLTITAAFFLAYEVFCFSWQLSVKKKAKMILAFGLVFLAVWFCMFSTDYKFYRNREDILFGTSVIVFPYADKQNYYYGYADMGYKEVTVIDRDSQIRSMFYLFGIKIDEISY